MQKTLFLYCLLFIQCSASQQPQQSREMTSTDPVEELKSMYNQFMTVPNAVDTNHDKSLSPTEVMAAPQNLKTLDKNGDGAIDWEEMGAWEDQLPLVREHNITNLIDANGDVHISAEEIKNAATELKRLDLNGDWSISKKELFFNKNPNFPLFTNKKMPYKRWRRFRGYTTKNEGTKPPGQDDRAFKGYTLIHDAGDSFLGQKKEDTYLMDENGKRVHEWKYSEGSYSPEASIAYLLPNGQLLRTFSKHHWIKDKAFPVGATSTIELVNWEGEVLWDFTQSVPEKYSFHHDVEYLPNGNILAIRYNAFTLDEIKALGWDVDLAKEAAFKIKNNIHKKGWIWMSNVVELKPNLADGSTEIVWQWNPWDHLVQNKYATKLNYGDITDPSKIHLNYLNLDIDVPYNVGQLFHLNAVNYNQEHDLILLNSPTYGEFWIIDHSTSTAEAKGSTGGKYGNGGDLLYRWGNGETYGNGTRDESTLYWQHDAQWIDEGLPGAGNILVYNNGQRRTLDGKYRKQDKTASWGKSYSNILEVKLPINEQGQFNQNQEAEIVWSWSHPDKTWYYSPFMSGATRLPNGNTIFNSAYDKYIHEVNSDGEIVLDYSLQGWGRLYRIYKYGADYSGLKFKK